MSKNYLPSEKIKHCCPRMTELLDDWRFPIDMDMVIRKYFIPYMWPHSVELGIIYCPWCGTKLPKVLHEAYYEILEKEFGITDPQDPNIPREFKSEEWWVKRGL
ncbi:MAG: hypothetical protein WC707_01070 [Candidatus Babeliaceae bacterium]